MATTTLHGETVDVVFHWQAARPEQGYFDAVIAMQLQSGLPPLKWQSVPSFVHLDDLRRLIMYFDEHVKALVQNGSVESPVFVPREMGFQVQALAGDVDGNDDGEFAVRVLVNVGQAEGCSRTFVGAEVVVAVAQIREFTEEMEALLSEQLAAVADSNHGVH